MRVPRPVALDASSILAVRTFDELLPALTLDSVFDGEMEAALGR